MFGVTTGVDPALEASLVEAEERDGTAFVVPDDTARRAPVLVRDAVFVVEAPGRRRVLGVRHNPKT